MIKSFIQTKYFNSMKHVKNYITYINKQSSLFGLEGDLALGNALAEVQFHPQSQYWRQIYSLSADDCERLSVDREYMKNLLIDKKADIAKAYNISPDKLRIAASWHVKDHHPHMHIVFYSTDKREGHLHVPKDGERKKVLNKASVKVKQSLTNEIFKNDLLAIKQLKYALRTDLNQQIEQDLKHIVAGKTGYKAPQGITEDLKHLGQSLAELSGKKSYGYLPPAIKKEVDDILQKITEKDKTAGKLFSDFAGTQKELIETYANHEETISSKMIKWQDEFYHPGKGDDTKRHNLIIAAAEKANWLTVKVSQRPAGTFVDKTPANIANNLMWGVCRSLKQNCQHAEQQNKQVSLYKLEKAAAQGNQSAQYKLGCLYLAGKVVSQDIPIALEYLTKSAEQENQFAQYKLGCLYLAGEIVPQNIPLALEYLTKSAEQENQFAQYKLGCLYLAGEVVPQNIPLALEYLTKSAEQENQFAQYKLGCLHLAGEVVPQNIPLALEYLTKSAEQENQFAQYKLGCLYLAGEIVPQNIPLALEYLTKSAEQENQFAYYKLGSLFAYGELVAKDEGKALDYFMKSMQLGCVAAQFEIGKIYFWGDDFKDKKMGLHWIKQAAANGDINAENFLAQKNMNTIHNLLRGIGTNSSQKAQQKQQNTKPTALRNKRLKKVTHRQNREENVYER